MSKLNLKQLRDRRANVVAQGRAVVEGYTSRGDGPSEDEESQVITLNKELEELEESIRQAESRADAERSFATVGDADTVTITGGAPRIEQDPKRGWKSFGEFASAVHKGSRNNAVLDDRLRLGAAPTTFANEGVGADGGFLIPPGFSQQLLEDSLADDALLPMTSDVPISGNTMSFPKNEDEPWSTAGIQAYWESEATQLTQTKPSIGLSTYRLRKLTALVPITDELAADAPAIGAFVEGETPKAMRAKINDALVNGDGAGKPVGVVGHGGTVSVAKETSQAAATVVIENLVKMYSRCINPGRAIWIANVDTFPQLYDMKDNAGARVWQTVAPGLSEPFQGMILGRPVMWVEACPTLGTVGDVVFGDWAQYRTITKAGGVQTATSMHLWFDYAVEAFRAIFRIDGQPWRSTTLTPQKGSATRGNFVTVATRA